MRTFDLSPLFRSTVGFDRMTRILEAALNGEEAANGYPPYNIEKLSEDDYRITMAVAGFSQDELEIVQRENTLVVVGKQAKDAENRQFLYRGIAGRQFERRFQLADHIKVVGANLVNGLLNIDLKREIPEAAKPRTIPIETAAPTARVLEQKVENAA